MKASTIAALLAFAAAARHSPEPSRSVADLAELIATHEVDQEEPAAATADPVATDPAAGVESLDAIAAAGQELDAPAPSDTKAEQAVLASDNDVVRAVQVRVRAPRGAT